MENRPRLFLSANRRTMGVGKEWRGRVQRTRRVWGHHGSCRLQEMWGLGLSQTGCSFMF